MGFFFLLLLLLCLLFDKKKNPEHSIHVDGCDLNGPQQWNICLASGGRWTVKNGAAPPLPRTQCPGERWACVPWLLSSHLSSLHSHNAPPASTGYTFSRKLVALNVCGSHETLLLVLMSTTSSLFFPCPLSFSLGM